MDAVKPACLVAGELVGESGLIHGVLVHSEGLHYPVIQGLGPSYSRRAMFAASPDQPPCLVGAARVALPPRRTKAELRSAVDRARRDGALLAVELGDAGWIRKRGGPKAAYELATIRPDIPLATQPPSLHLALPVEGLA